MNTRVRTPSFRLLRTLKALSFALGIFSALPLTSYLSVAAEFTVYSAYQPLDLGGSTEAPKKDFYVNMGTAHGLRVGALLDVYRRTPTYDVSNQKSYRDLTFKIGSLRVIHTEGDASVARLEKLLPQDQTPALSQPGVMVGDIVRVSK